MMNIHCTDGTQAMAWVLFFYGFLLYFVGIVN